MPVPRIAVDSPAERSPSEISLMRAPASRISAISSSWRVPVEHDDREVVHLAVERLGDAREVVLDRGVDVDAAARRGPDHDLLHVDVGRVEEPALARRGEHRDGVVGSGRAQVGPLERVHGDVDLGVPEASVLVGADLLADVQHGCLVALALPDHDGAVDREGVHLRAHGLHGDLVGVLALAVAHRARGGDGRLLGDSQEVWLEVYVHLDLRMVQISPRIRSGPELAILRQRLRRAPRALDGRQVRRASLRLLFRVDRLADCGVAGLVGELVADADRDAVRPGLEQQVGRRSKNLPPRPARTRPPGCDRRARSAAGRTACPRCRGRRSRP